MDAIVIIKLLLGLLFGVSLFLFGMGVMGDALKKVAGNKLESLLYKLTNTPIKGILLGAGVTAIIQSSSATSVMVVGFVNSGMMKVVQGIGIIMGANIGTSITGWILCLNDIEGAGGIATLLSSSSIAAIVAIIGLLVNKLAKKDAAKYTGDIMLGFAVLMEGMTVMKTAMNPLKESEAFTNALGKFTNPFLGILAGILFTAVLQSASASIGILQSLAATSYLPFAAALPIIMGVGIGAAAPVLMSGMGSSKNGKRTALAYLLNDLLGMMIWASVFYISQAIITGGGQYDFMTMKMSSVSIALLNSVYRILNISTLSPFIKKLDKLVHFIIKDDPNEEAEMAELDLLEERFLAYPDLALAQSHTVMVGMAQKAQRNLNRAFDLMDNYSSEGFQVVKDKEAVLDKYEDKLANYLTKTTVKDLSVVQSKEASKLLHTITDFERIGDHASGISKVAKEMDERQLAFSSEANQELAVLKAAVTEIMDITVRAFEKDDPQVSHEVEPLRRVITSLCRRIKKHHIRRLQNSQCDVNQGFVFNDYLNNLDRIGAHCSNVAVAIIEQKEQIPEDAHDYLKRIRTSNDNGFEAMLDKYAAKYSLDQIKA